MENNETNAPTAKPGLSLGLAVGITVAVALPFGFFLGPYNFPLWVAFIVWAEYFALGANPGNFKLIVPSIVYGAFMGALWNWLTILVAGRIGGDLMAVYIALTATGFVVMYLLCHYMGKVESLGKGSLAVFNGLTLFLAVNGTNSIPHIGPVDNPYFATLMAWVWVCVLGLFGWLLGWFNVAIMTPGKKAE